MMKETEIAGKIVSKMIYTVSNGMLNPTILYYCTQQLR